MSKNIKTCPKCEETKDIGEFYNNKNSSDGKCCYCKECSKKRVKKYRKENREKINRKARNRYRKNREKYKKYKRDYFKENKEKHRKWRNTYRDKNPSYRVRLYLGNRLRNCIKNKNNSIINLLGLSIEEFKEYLESQFTDEMSWDNYGDYWHVDHIIPCSWYNLEKEHHQEECFFYTNMQPLEAKENLRKSNKLDY